MPEHQATIVLNDKKYPAIIEYYTDYPVIGDRQLTGIKNIIIVIDSIKCQVKRHKSNVTKQSDEYNVLLSDELISELESEIKESLIKAEKADRWASYDLNERGGL